MTKYFLIYHIGHGGGGWLYNNCNNYPGRQGAPRIWVLGEVHKPCQLDFEGRGLTKAEDLDREIENYFDDADYWHRTLGENGGVISCGVIKTFRRAAVDYVRSMRGRWIQMIRNPIAKCGGRVLTLSKADAAGPYYERKHGHPPRDRVEMIDAHMLYFKEEFYDHFIHRARKYRHLGKWRLLRLEDLNQSMELEHGLGFYKRVMEWLTQVPWPDEYIESIWQHQHPNLINEAWIEWTEEIDPTVGRKRIKDVGSKPSPWLYPARTKHWGLDPETMYFWTCAFDDVTRALYKKHFGQIEEVLGYNQSYPGSVHQGWEFYNAYNEWGGIYG